MAAPKSPPGLSPTPPGAPRQVGARSSQLSPQNTAPPRRDRHEELAPQKPLPTGVSADRGGSPCPSAALTAPAPLPPPSSAAAASPVILSGSPRPARAPGLPPHTLPAPPARRAPAVTLPTARSPPASPRRGGADPVSPETRAASGPYAPRAERGGCGGRGAGRRRPGRSSALPPPPSGAGQAGPFLTQLCPGPPPSGRPPRGGLGAGGRVLGRGPRGGVSLRREGFGGHPKAEDHKQGHPGLLGTGHRGGLGGQGRCWGPWSECFGLSEPCQEQPTREVTGGYGKAPGVLSHQRKTWPVGLPPEGRTVSGKRTAGLDGTAVLGHV